MLTPDEFYRKYNGKAYAETPQLGVQCVYAFKLWCKENLGYTWPTKTGWADGYWTYRNDHAKEFTFITNPKQFRNGDWAIWKRGNDSACKLSHIAMYYNGKFFSQRQGAPNRAFSLKAISTYGVLGAFRWKGYEKMTEVKYGTQTELFTGPTTANIKITTYRANSKNGYTLHLIPAGDNSTSLADIMDIDSPNLLVTAKGGNSFFQMQKGTADPYGTHYGVEQDATVAGYTQAPKSENLLVFYEDKDGNDHVLTANDYWLKQEEVNFAVTPYAVRIHAGKLSYYRSAAYGDQDDQPHNQSFAMKIGTDWVLGVGWNCVPRDLAAYGQACGASELFIMDGGGSAQIVTWDPEKKQMTKQLHTGRAVPDTLALAKPIAAVLPAETDDTPAAEKPQEQPAETPEEQPKTDTQPEENTPETPAETPKTDEKQTDGTDTKPEEKPAETGINWAQKLSSRKLWAAIIPFITGLMMRLGMSQNTAEEIGSLLLMILPPVAYVIAEGLVDSARQKTQTQTAEQKAAAQQAEKLAEIVLEQVEKKLIQDDGATEEGDAQ